MYLLDLSASIATAPSKVGGGKSGLSPSAWALHAVSLNLNFETVGERKGGGRYCLFPLLVEEGTREKGGEEAFLYQKYGASPPSAMLLLAQAFGRALKLAESTGWLLHALYMKRRPPISQFQLFCTKVTLWLLRRGGEKRGRVEKRKRLAGQFQAGGKEAIGGGGEEKGERVEN